MIEPKELRIGNMVIINGKIKEVESIGENWLNIDASAGGWGDSGSIDYEYWKKNISTSLEGIPITEEWLIKLGFDVDIDKTLPYTKAYSKGGIIFDSEFYLTVEGAESELHTIGNNLKHIHQLQNLYFALTGNELEIK